MWGGSRHGESVVLIQEGPTSSEEVHEVLDTGHLWFVAPKGDRFRSIAVFFHQRWKFERVKPEIESLTSRVAFLDLDIGGQKTRFISEFLPHLEYLPPEFDAAL